MLDHPAVATAEQTCAACPEQWEGTLVDGRSFYLRYRFGRATLGIGRFLDEAVRDPNEVEAWYGDALAGTFKSDRQRIATFGFLFDLHEAMRERMTL